MKNESIENRLFDLIETYTFEALNEDDKLFVLSNMSEQEYMNQQKVIGATSELIYPQVVPLPLAIPEKKASGLLIPIPLYKVLIGAAAAFVGVWYFWPSDNPSEKRIAKNTDPIMDTVYVTKTKRDTLYLESGNPLVAVNEKAPDTVYVIKEIKKENGSKRMLEAVASQPNIVFDESIIKTKGQSLKNDKTANLLPKTDGFGI